jgi:hypothetical protein
MEEKLEKFHRYDFANDEKWQSKLKNIYPMPPQAKLDIMKRKWFKANVDKDFDVDY